jgi:hypothetical protein
MRAPHAQQPPMSFRCNHSNERSVLFMTRAASSLWGMRRSKNSFGLTTGHTRTSIYVDTPVAIIGWRADRYCVRMASMMVLVSKYSQRGCAKWWLRRLLVGPIRANRCHRDYTFEKRLLARQHREVPFHDIFLGDGVSAAVLPLPWLVSLSAARKCYAPSYQAGRKYQAKRHIYIDSGCRDVHPSLSHVGAISQQCQRPREGIRSVLECCACPRQCCAS